MGETTIIDASNPFAYLAAAATGDIGAQRALAMQAVAITQDDPTTEPLSALREGLVFARLAAAHSAREDSDDGRVIAMLALAADLCELDGDSDTADIFGGEALARVSLMAERGVALADEMLPRAIEHSRANTMVEAKWFERAMREHGGSA